ncbi:MAG: hypothetical protein M1824_000515 [Vezdaea acicularis]|nr:MAG: hypothetical protein M1824_000515 [Vezdaea acicularis]
MTKLAGLTLDMDILNITVEIGEKAAYNGFSALQLAMLDHDVVTARHSRVCFSTLTNVIHPLFAPQKWVSTNNEIMSIMLPSLQLASHLLTLPSNLEWWHTLIFAERKRLSGLPNTRPGVEAKTVTHRNDGQRTFEMENVLRTLQWLAGAEQGVDGDAITFEVCDFAPLVKPCDREAYTVLTGTGLPVRRFGEKTGVKSRILINSDILLTMVELEGAKPDDEVRISQLLRIQTALAIHFVRGIAHAVEMALHHGRPAIGYSEPYLNGERIADVADSWESSVFGGLIRGYGSDPEHFWGTACFEWPSVELQGKYRQSEAVDPCYRKGRFKSPLRGEDTKSSKIWPVCMDRIQEMHTDEFWQYENAFHDRVLSSFPLSTSIHSIMIPNDSEKVARGETRDLERWCNIANTGSDSSMEPHAKPFDAQDLFNPTITAPPGTESWWKNPCERLTEQWWTDEDKEVARTYAQTGQFCRQLMSEDITPEQWSAEERQNKKTYKEAMRVDLPLLC